MDRAWHLRQDGKAFPVKIHMYSMYTDDLSSEAESAAFIISSKSKDQDLAEYVLDAWMALRIEQEISYDADEEDINEAIREALSHLPYRFAYPLSESQLLDIHRRQKNYHDVDSLYDFIDKVRDEMDEIQENIRRSLNQQFCRVRYGGQYNSVAGNNEIWFRVSSVDYNWANTIYLFVSSIYRSYKISHITICRDSESDGGYDNNVEYFYKAKDGTMYKHLPIDEYLQEEHEHNPVFESIDLNEGPLCTLRKSLMNGKTYRGAHQFLESAGVSYRRDLWKYLIRTERMKYCQKSNNY